ncbi:MAG: ATP:cob(I)alamin adenosyltransferase [Acidobacteria bacterium RIFCSPLOWO2_12_FULL_54_10]|nr:MAG: ATP:cob(I)alamin adenosyltransferase [Acidobacteria bacterium RIFCSPLOWO2_12_FULL_54_10]
MRITKVYTRTGDAGETGLTSGERVSKASLRVCAYGDVDELNSFLGLAWSRILDVGVQNILRQIQNDLFLLGADLSTPLPDSDQKPSFAIRRTTATEVELLERLIDRYNEALPPLQEFILPSGSETASLLHVARSVARRAERQAVRLSESEKINPHTIVYLNRLSDLLFVLARWVNRTEGCGEVFASFT